MKKLHNIFDEKTYSKSKFDRDINAIISIALALGIVFFLSIFIRLIYPFISDFIKNHGVNFKVIWSDCSPYIVGLFVFVFVPIVIWSYNNYKRSLREEYLVKTTSKLCTLNNQIDELKASNDKLRDEKKHERECFDEYRKDTIAERAQLRQANKILRESNMRLFEKTPAARLRDEKGHFLPKPKK